MEERYYRIQPAGDDPQDLLEPGRTSTVWAGMVWRRCEECRGTGEVTADWDTDDGYPGAETCPVCDGMGEIDDSTRPGVSACRSIEELLAYFRGRGATLDDVVVVEMSGTIIGEDWDADAGAVLVQPSQIESVRPLTETERAAIEAELP